MPQRRPRMRSIAAASTLPSTDPRDWSREQKIRWCRNRAMAAPWDRRVASMIRDMQQLGCPLDSYTVHVGRTRTTNETEETVNQWLEGIQ
jgi:hypothetical protein